MQHILRFEQFSYIEFLADQQLRELWSRFAAIYATVEFTLSVILLCSTALNESSSNACMQLFNYIERGSLTPWLWPGTVWNRAAQAEGKPATICMQLHLRK